VIELKDLTKTVKTFRNFCLKKFSSDIDSINPKERYERLGDYYEDDLEKFLTLGLSNRPLDLISQILTTPRLLKIVLRRVWNTWNILHGEIDYDDLLVSNVLRYGAPEAFEFILVNLNEIRGLQIEGIARTWDENKNQLEEKWKKIIQNVNWNVSTAEELLAFLFPFWKKMYQADSIEIPQGVRHSEPTDYWIRLNLEEVTEEEVRDQKVIHALNIIKSDPNAICYDKKTLIHALYNNEKLASKVEQFARIFLNGNDFRAMAQELFDIILNQNGSAANGDSSPAFFSLWRLSIRSPIDKKVHFEWILKEVRKALSISLSFANDLYYYWKHNDRSLIDANAKVNGLFQELRNGILERAETLFTNSPKNLITVLSSKIPYSVFQFTRLYSSQKEGGSGFKPNEWKWFMDVLLETAELDHKIIIPQICHLLIHTNRTHDGYVYNFEIDLAAELFHDKLPQVMEILAKDLETNDMDDSEKQRIAFAKDTAIKWLNDN